MKKLFVLIIPLLLLVGCGTGKYDKAMDQAKTAIAIGDFDKAVVSLKVALVEKPEDEEANKLYNNLKALNQVKADIDNDDRDAALTKANNLMKEETLATSIKKELEQYIDIAEEPAASAKPEASVSTSEEESSNSTSADSEKAETYVSTSEKEENSQSKREEYLKKIKDIEKSLSNLENTLANGTQSEMNQAQGEIFKKWDQALNEIYGVLETQLPTSEMSRLREEQREWIKRRDAVAKDASLKYKGGTMESLQYSSTLAQVTKERCYELIGGYMK